MDEFELIRKYFDRHRNMPGMSIGIGDDGAVLVPDPRFDQVHVIDTLVENVHFPNSTNPADIAYRAVAVNFSDIAAMGARPRWMTLALTMSTSDEQWLSEFANGLFDAADAFDAALVGGDTTRGAAVVVSVAVTGEVEKGRALLRSGAQPGDTLYVTGTLGDAAAGLELLQRGERHDYLAGRFLRPTPRIATGRALIGKANAAIDVSDGFMGDLKKLLTASSVGADVNLALLPTSDALQSSFDVSEQQQFALTGGDDYELCFTAPFDSVKNIDGITAIGQITELTELVCHRDGDIVEVDHSGYRHFS